MNLLRFPLVIVVFESDIEVPRSLEDVVWLNPWAVTMRYDELESPLDRRAALASAEAAVAWADGLLASSR